eukprot:CAMPEP_0206236618 /NCGR_PEP_ID=MMETSP0047_2-20121206/13815_1 /ASSEMBLY_ACC=CAM_ASM_000192 /TAXON_ID=195065 /ORGANISM="Chroomonas mesostigmatica_cf, Strain CCMP1168" /LENGTH=133 /DNA_ID=CAMNT_0053660973 /DNA_START=598 /DNA_END=997 /DNA_ORIENTATION=-
MKVVGLLSPFNGAPAAAAAACSQKPIDFFAWESATAPQDSQRPSQGPTPHSGQAGALACWHQSLCDGLMGSLERMIQCEPSDAQGRGFHSESSPSRLDSSTRQAFLSSECVTLAVSPSSVAPEAEECRRDCVQ